MKLLVYSPWLLILSILLTGCGGLHPLRPFEAPLNDSILNETHVSVPQFLAINDFEFSPDQSKVAVLGFPREYDDNTLDPASIDTNSATLIVFEWPTLTELYRYDQGPDDNSLVQIRWSPNGNLLYVIYTGPTTSRLLIRIDLTAREIASIPFDQWDFVVSPRGDQIIAWGSRWLSSDLDRPRYKWIWNNELFIYDATSLEALKMMRVPEINTIGLVYVEKEHGHYLIASPSNCRNPDMFSADGSMYAPTIRGCDNTIYRYNANDNEIALALDIPLDEQKGNGIPDGVWYYNSEIGLLMRKNTLARDGFTFIDIDNACIAFELPNWSVTLGHIKWYGNEHIAHAVWSTSENRTPEIRLYHIQELAESHPSCFSKQGFSKVVQLSF